VALKDVANEDLKVGFTNSAGPPDLVYSTDPGIDPIKVVAVKAPKVKADGKVVCTTSITITWTAATPCPFSSATYNFVSGAAVIMPGATKTKAGGALVLRKDDQAMNGCLGGWTLKASPFTPMACACSCKIADAGQTKVKAQ
jgi:hypothetical protein